MLLKEAKLLSADKSQASRDGQLSYSLSAVFSKDASQAIRPLLAQLGSVGLDERISRIQQEEGLLP